MTEADIPVSLAASSPGSLVFPVPLLLSILPVHVCDMLSLVDTSVVKAWTSSVSYWGIQTQSFGHTACKDLATRSDEERSIQILPCYYCLFSYLTCIR